MIRRVASCRQRVGVGPKNRRRATAERAARTDRSTGAPYSTRRCGRARGRLVADRSRASDAHHAHSCTVCRGVRQCKGVAECTALHAHAHPPSRGVHCALCIGRQHPTPAAVQRHGDASAGGYVRLRLAGASQTLQTFLLFPRIARAHAHTRRSRVKLCEICERLKQGVIQGTSGRVRQATTTR